MKTNHILTIASLLVAMTIFATLGEIRRSEARYAQPTTAMPMLPAASVYRLPLRGDDLYTNERYGVGVHQKGNPDQVNALDIGGRRWVSADAKWSRYTSDNVRTNLNTSYVVYGKPFYAMAGGTVISCWRNAPENVPGSNHRDKDKIPNGGNHVWIRQDDGVAALYAHAMPNSIPKSICSNEATLMKDTTIVGNDPALRKEAQVTNGVRVEAGDKLGLVGNSGDSGGPHLHVHMLKDRKPVVMKFARGLTTAFVDEKAKLDGSWKALDGNAMPDNVLFWPPRPRGNYTYNGSTPAGFQRLFEHLSDSGEMANIVTCQSNGATYNSTWVPATGPWVMQHGMSAAVAAAKHAEYTAKGFRRTSSYTCGAVSVAVWRKS